jgi:hypothetical protein
VQVRVSSEERDISGGLIAIRPCHLGISPCQPMLCEEMARDIGVFVLLEDAGGCLRKSTEGHPSGAVWLLRHERQSASVPQLGFAEAGKIFFVTGRQCP